MVIIPNLKAGDVITITGNNDAINNINTTKYAGTKNDGNTTLTFTMEADGNFYFKMVKGGATIDNVTVYPTIRYITVTREVYAEPVKTWNLKTASWAKESGFGTSTVTINSQSCTYANGDLEGLALQGGSGTAWAVNSNGLSQGNGTRNIAVLNLKAKDVVIVETNTSGISGLVNGVSLNDTYTGTCKFSVVADGNFGFKVERYTSGNVTAYVTSITVCREYVPPIADGDYYLKNKSTGAYLAAGASWSTQAITNLQGHRVNLAYQNDGKYHINTYVYRDQNKSSSLHYLKDDFFDGEAQGWTLTSDDEGFFTLSNASGNLTGNAVGAAASIASGSTDNAKWKLLTKDEWLADNETRISAATYANGIDATFYIAAPDFNWADNDEREKWQGNPSINGFNQGISGRFYNAEKFNTTPFDVYQTLTSVLPGCYKVTIDGFYRNGTTDDRNALLYANSFETPLVNIKSAGITAQDDDKGFTKENGGYYVPDSQSEAAKAFNSGYYDNELYFVVGEDGALQIGVKKEIGATNDWAIFDNFLLTYYGTSVPATLGANGYTTFASPYPLDLAHLPEGLKAYTATLSGVTLSFTECTQAVPAGTGLLLQGTGGETYDIPVVAEGATVSNNALTGVTAVTPLKSDTENYIFAMRKATNADDPLSFAPLTSEHNVNFPAGKAYIEVPASAFQPGARALVLTFDDATSVKELKNSGIEELKAYYNLQGQRVASPKKGLYIVNGRKVQVK